MYIILYIYTCACAYTCVYIHIHIHIYIGLTFFFSQPSNWDSTACRRARFRRKGFQYIFIYIIHIYNICTCTCTYTYTCVHIYIYISTYIYTLCFFPFHSLQIGIQRLADALDSVGRDSDRYTLIVDLGGNAATYLKYRDVNMAMAYKPGDCEVRFLYPFVHIYIYVCVSMYTISRHI